MYGYVNLDPDTITIILYIYIQKFQSPVLKRPPVVQWIISPTHKSISSTLNPRL